MKNKIDLKSAPTPAPAAPKQATIADSPIVMRRLAEMQTPMGYMATAPLSGLTNTSYVIVYGDGAITAANENGDIIWNHGSLDFTRWTGRYPPYQNGNVVIWNPRVPLGADPIDPLQQTGEHPFATGDLTGDGADDVAIAHFFQAGVNAVTGPSATMVSVLDGRNGNLVWSHMYTGFVNNLAIANGMLVVAFDNAESGSMSILHGWQFTNGGATVTVAWSVSTGISSAHWLALEKLPNGKIAAAWTNTPIGSTDTTHGHELVVSLGTGSTDWSVTTTNYPRKLRFDSTRNQIVAIEEADTSLGYSYSLVARNLNDGSVATTINQTDATAIDLQVGDLDGNGNADYVVSDVTFLASTFQNSGRVRAINPATGAEMWARVSTPQFVDPNNPLAGTDIARSYGMQLIPTATGADVLAGTFVPGGAMELQRINGAAGAVLWSQSAPNLFMPLFMSIFEKAGAQFVRVAASRPHYYGGGISLILDNLGAEIVLDGLTPYQVVRSFNIATGAEVSAVPFLGRIHAVAGTDVNGDGKSDLVVGGETNAVFALDGNKIDSSPIFLWRKTVAGPVHQIDAADLDGDGHAEIVVAATHAIDVLDAATGNLKYEIPFASDYIWNFQLADLLGNGKIDIVVPTSSSVRAYKHDGSALWNYTPINTQNAALFSNVAITPDKIVTAQFAYGSQNPAQRTGGGFSRGVVGINGATGALLWSDTNASDGVSSWFPQFWHGTVAGQLDGILGSVVGYSFVGYDFSKDPPTPVTECDGCFTPAMEIRNALTGVIINSLPLPWIYNGSEGTLLIPEKGILSYAGNASWMLTPNNSGQALGSDIPLDMAEGNFGSLGKRVVELDYPWYTRVFPRNGIDVGSWTTFVPKDANYWHTIAPTRIFLRDLDGDGADEIIRAQFDYDGDASLVAAIQGWGLEPKPYSDGLDIVDLVPAPLEISAITRLTNAHVLVQGNAGQGINYTLEASPDLSPGSWAAIATVKSNIYGILEYEDKNAGNFSQRFYRFTYP